MQKLNEFIEIIKKAGEIFKEGYNKKLEIHSKGIKDLVTDYDVKVEKFLINEFKSKFSDYSIIAEETTQENFNNSIIIDPIDGTTNFAHHIPHCAISIGVYEKKEPKYAIVYNPVLNELYSAKKGEGAFKNGKKITVSNQDDFQRSLIATGFPYSSAENEDDLKWVINKLKHILPRCQDIRRLGSAALDLCYVAEGKYEGFYEINLKPWDVSAGILIVQEAGGIISNEYGNDYDLFEDKCIVASNGIIHNEMVEIVSKKINEILMIF